VQVRGNIVPRHIGDQDGNPIARQEPDVQDIAADRPFLQAAAAARCRPRTVIGKSRAPSPAFSS
jgi:hypothetical protein